MFLCHLHFFTQRLSSKPLNYNSTYALKQDFSEVPLLTRGQEQSSPLGTPVIHIKKDLSSYKLGYIKFLSEGVDQIYLKFQLISHTMTIRICHNKIIIQDKICFQTLFCKFFLLLSRCTLYPELKTLTAIFRFTFRFKIHETTSWSHFQKQIVL